MVPRQPVAPPASTQPSLKQRAVRGSLWTLMGFGGGQALRFGGNLLLTRLLFPEAFGLMALVQVFMQGLEMFSDLGIVPSIIQNRRGDDPAFLNTAWTLQVMRGAALSLLAWVIAYPAAQIYQEPMLAQLMPVAGLTAVISGFNSTQLATVNRALRLGSLTLLELGSYSVGLVIMVVLAWLYQSVWALVIGSLVGTGLKAAFSHYLMPGSANYFCWDQRAFQELYRFGRWIFLGTLLTFLAGQGDRLVLGLVLDVKTLGIYTLAIALAAMPWQIIQRLVDRVLFPSYAEVYRESPGQMYAILQRSRLVMIAGSWVASLSFIAWGPQLINLLYDARYADAGWMLQIIAFGSLAAVISGTYDGVLLARGQSQLATVLLTMQIVIQFAAMAVGFRLAGAYGLIAGIAASRWILYPFKMIVFRRLALWQPEIDLPFLGVASLIVALSLLS